MITRSPPEKVFDPCIKSYEAYFENNINSRACDLQIRDIYLFRIKFLWRTQYNQHGNQHNQLSLPADVFKILSVTI